MCGILGYIGEKQANEILIHGLEQLEYRGYDSAGICTIFDGSMKLNKVKGRVANLKTIILPGTIGIAHTRWATHGKPSDSNAHPFISANKEFSVVHNGIIENYLELKEELRQDGVDFSSETDSEVIVHLIAKHYQDNLQDAVLKTLQKLQGAYAFCVIKKDLQEVIGARNGSPLVIGMGNNENFFASDVSALIKFTKKVVYLDDFQVARITNSNISIIDFAGREQQIAPKIISWDLEQAQKQCYKHFMLKEIFEQPTIAEDILKINLNEIQKLTAKTCSRIIIVACGTASYAGLIIKYLLEKIARIPVDWEIASEFRYKQPILPKDSVVIAISQSGETADTLAAIKLAKKERIYTIGIINVVDSTIAREVDQVIYTRAGPEIGVASTKAFLAQLIVGYQLAFHLSSPKDFLKDISTELKKVLNLDAQIKEIAQKYYLYHHFLYIGRNTNYPLALEGALKLKEISYIHAEAYPAGELKHGPIALVSEEIPTIAICPQDESYHKTHSNIEEIKARNGKVIAIATEGDQKLNQLCDDIIFVPKVDSILYPLIIIIPLQLFAYHIANLKECDIDKPRNLAKSVTVE